MTGSSRPLQEARDRSRRAELTHKIDIADVDPEFERRGGDQCLQFASLQPLLGIEPLIFGETAMMGGDIRLAEQLGKLPRHPLRHSARVHEDECRAVLFDQSCKSPVDLFPHLRGHDRLERRIRYLQSKVAVAAMS